jgi:hypothetical protein
VLGILVGIVTFGGVLSLLRMFIQLLKQKDFMFELTKTKKVECLVCRRTGGKYCIPAVTRITLNV